MHQLVRAGAFVVGQFQTVERAGPRQRHPAVRRVEAIPAQGIQFVAGRGQQWIQPQPVMIIEIFVAQRQAVDPLCHQLPHE